MTTARIRSLTLNSSLLCLLLAGGCSPAAEEENEDAWSADLEADTAPMVEQESGADDTRDEPLGTLAVTEGDQRTELAVRSCDVRSIPGDELAIAWFWVDADDPVSSADKDEAPWRLELQIQEQQDRSDVMLLSFDNESGGQSMTGRTGEGAPSSYQLSADGTAFDVRKGTNGALAINFDPLQEAPTAAVELIFTAAALRQTDSATEPFVETSISGELAARCAFGWRQ